MRKIHILGIPYKVSFDHSFEELGENQGLFDSARQTIFIANDIGEDARRYTIVHECIEALNFHLELGLEHRQITGMEVGIYSILLGLENKHTPQLSDEVISLGDWS